MLAYMVCIVVGIGGLPVLGVGVLALWFKNNLKNVSYRLLVFLFWLKSSWIL